MLGWKDGGERIRSGRGEIGGREGTETRDHQCGEGNEDDNLELAFED